jgi:hypothetical protein
MSTITTATSLPPMGNINITVFWVGAWIAKHRH